MIKQKKTIFYNFGLFLTVKVDKKNNFSWGVYLIQRITLLVAVFFVLPQQTYFSSRGN